MADEFNVTFSSSSEEIKYWKSLCIKYKQSAESTKEELEEFQTSSHELELELEAQLETAEAKNKELSASSARLTMELDSLREKLEKQHSTNHRQVSDLETKLAKSEAFTEALQKYVRELEQANDDLERAKRAAVVSLEDFELRLNQAIERNAFLESELDEKENLAVCVQRLKDEARDLRQELAVRHQKPDGDTVSHEGSPAAGQLDSLPPPAVSRPDTILTASPARRTEAGDICLPTSPSVREPTGLTPITPASRISALNIVSDLLRKLGALESKLATCRAVDRSQMSAFHDTQSSSLPDVLHFSTCTPQRRDTSASNY